MLFSEMDGVKVGCEFVHTCLFFCPLGVGGWGGGGGQEGGGLKDIFPPCPSGHIFSLDKGESMCTRTSVKPIAVS